MYSTSNQKYHWQYKGTVLFDAAMAKSLLEPTKASAVATIDVDTKPSSTHVSLLHQIAQQSDSRHIILSGPPASGRTSLLLDLGLACNQTVIIFVGDTDESNVFPLPCTNTTPSIAPPASLSRIQVRRIATFADCLEQLWSLPTDGVGAILLDDVDTICGDDWEKRSLLGMSIELLQPKFVAHCSPVASLLDAANGCCNTVYVGLVQDARHAVPQTTGSSPSSWITVHLSKQDDDSTTMVRVGDRVVASAKLQHHYELDEYIHWKWVG